MAGESTSMLENHEQRVGRARHHDGGVGCARTRMQLE
jgi:hypothetical protein